MFKCVSVFSYKLSDALRELKSVFKSSLDSHLVALILIDRYGTQLASVSEVNLPKEIVSKVCAVLYGSAERLGENMGKGAPRMLMVEYDEVELCVLKSMSGKYLLVGLCDRPTEETLSKLFDLSLKV